VAHRDKYMISPATLALAALASATTTFLLGSVGLAGTIVGAALTPVLVAVVTEFARKPADRLRTAAVRVPSSRGGERTVFRVEREPRRLLDRISWRRALLTGLGAFALVVAAVTLADLGRGTSVVSDRGTTFFDRERGGSPNERRDERGPGTRTDPGETVVPEEPPPESQTETSPPTTEPNPATTESPATTTTP
jgi:hypothetical protein